MKTDKPSPLFPLFIDLYGSRCLVVGAGTVASHKKAILESFGAEVGVSTDFKPADIQGMRLVVAATNDSAMNRAVSQHCQAAGIPVNVVDDPALCTFVFPALVQKGPLVVAASSGGASPAVAQYLRDQVKPFLTDRLTAATEHLYQMRARMKAEFPNFKERAERYREELRKWIERGA